MHFPQRLLFTASGFDYANSPTASTANDDDRYLSPSNRLVRHESVSPTVSHVRRNEQLLSLTASHIIRVQQMISSWFVPKTKKRRLPTPLKS